MPPQRERESVCLSVCLSVSYLSLSVSDSLSVLGSAAEVPQNSREEIDRPEMPAVAMLPLVALSVAALHARLHVTDVAPRVPDARRVVLMSTAEEEAKRAWMAKQEREMERPRISNEEVQASMHAANAAARARGLAAMGGKDALRSGKMQGFGAEDTEYYGYGEQQLMEMPDDREIDLLTGKPLSQGGDYDPRAQGFGGRSAGWARKPETTPSGPPPMEGTLRAPGQVRLTPTLILSPGPGPSPSPSPSLNWGRCSSRSRRCPCRRTSMASPTAVRVTRCRAQLQRRRCRVRL